MGIQYALYVWKEALVGWIFRELKPALDGQRSSLVLMSLKKKGSRNCRVSSPFFTMTATPRGELVRKTALV